MLDRVYWKIENRVVMSEFSGLLTLEDYQYSSEQVAQLVALLDESQRQQRIHFILDTIRLDGVDRSMMNLKKLHTQTLRTNANTEHPDSWFIVVDDNPNPIMSFLTQTVMQVMKLRYRIVPSLDEAMIFLKEQDNTLPDTTSD